MGLEAQAHRPLSEKLRADGVTVGEVIGLGLVKGTIWDTGSATIEPRTVAEFLGILLQARIQGCHFVLIWPWTS